MSSDDDTINDVAAEPSLPEGWEINGPAEVRLAGIYRAAVYLGFGLLTLGAALQLTMDGQLTPSLVVLNELPGGLLRLEPDAAITLGLLVFIAAPATGLASLVLSYAKERERVALLVVLAVLTIIFLSIPLQYLFEGPN